MSYTEIRNQLNKYYFQKLPDIAESIRKNTFEKLDKYAENNPYDNAYKMKSMQYETIVDEIKVKLFDDIPFFFETGALVAWCDGRYDRGAMHANGWLYLRNSHIFEDIDPYAYDLYNKQVYNSLFAQCGIYADMMHQGLPLKKIFNVGLKGILQELDEVKTTCTTDEESDFTDCCITGIKALCKMAEKFAELAKKEGRNDIAKLAQKVPYNPPETVHEGLCVLAFMRKALGSIEGMGYSSFGRVDVLMADLYVKSSITILKSGKIPNAYNPCNSRHRRLL
jgi:hypothetical protein